MLFPDFFLYLQVFIHPKHYLCQNYTGLLKDEFCKLDKHDSTSAD